MRVLRTRTMTWMSLVLCAVLLLAVAYVLWTVKNIPTSNTVLTEKQDSIVTSMQTKDKFEGKICVCLGDSILGNYEDSKSYTAVIAQQTGMQVVNGGFGGCKMAYNPEVNPEFDAFAMYRLADAIATGDWSLQEQNANKHPYKETPARVEVLKNLNWAEVDYLTIGFGTNDVQGHGYIEKDDNKKAIDSYMGALRYSIERIQKQYPQIKILLVTPIYRFWAEDSTDSDNKLFTDPYGNEHKFTDWVDAMIQVAEEYKVPYVDLYRNLGFNSVTRSYFFNSDDGTHPNANGVARIGDAVSSALDSKF